jgi:hypothetical protein
MPSPPKSSWINVGISILFATIPKSAIAEAKPSAPMQIKAKISDVPSPDVSMMRAYVAIDGSTFTMVSEIDLRDVAVNSYVSYPFGAMEFHEKQIFSSGGGAFLLFNSEGFYRIVKNSICYFARGTINISDKDIKSDCFYLYQNKGQMYSYWSSKNRNAPQMSPITFNKR